MGVSFLLHKDLQDMAFSLSLDMPSTMLPSFWVSSIIQFLLGSPSQSSQSFPWSTIFFIFSKPMGNNFAS